MRPASDFIYIQLSNSRESINMRYARHLPVRELPIENCLDGNKNRLFSNGQIYDIIQKT